MVTTRKSKPLQLNNLSILPAVLRFLLTMVGVQAVCPLCRSQLKDVPVLLLSLAQSAHTTLPKAPSKSQTTERNRASCIYMQFHQYDTIASSPAGQ